MKEKNKKITFCISQLTLNKARELSAQWDRTVSSTLRILIDKAYAKKEEDSIC